MLLARLPGVAGEVVGPIEARAGGGADLLEVTGATEVRARGEQGGDSFIQLDGAVVLRGGKGQDTFLFQDGAATAWGAAQAPTPLPFRGTKPARPTACGSTVSTTPIRWLSHGQRAFCRPARTASTILSGRGRWRIWTDLA
ncbi:MAG: hypothetical protein HUJ24_07035 [Rhodobacteraceae bacterium]|nr:hypothetical protein [Paracoccaceae bacterium]